jgi:hypothetical protein
VNATVTLLLVVLNVAVLIALPALALMLKAYASEKGRNLATKEDVASITNEIEGVRSQHLAALEHLRSDLARGLNMHKVRYETELDTYKEIWAKLVPLEHATLLLRPTKVFGAVPTGPIDEHNRQLLKAFWEAFAPFSDLVYKTRPFYPESVYRELTNLMHLVHGEALDFRLRDPAKDQDYWDKALANADAIIGQIDKICDTIRSRLTETGGGLDLAKVD